MLGEITRAAMPRAIFKAHCYTGCHLLAISTYMHSKAQTTLGRFVVDILYKQVCNKKSKLMELEPQCIGSAVGDRNSGLLSATLLI